MILRRIAYLLSLSVRGRAEIGAPPAFGSRSPGESIPEPRARGVPDCTKGVIRARPILVLDMVTGEFYARVTTSWVTGRSVAALGLEDKRPA